MPQSGPWREFFVCDNNKHEKHKGTILTVTVTTTNSKARRLFRFKLDKQLPLAIKKQSSFVIFFFLRKCVKYNFLSNLDFAVPRRRHLLAPFSVALQCVLYPAA
jgi:hypothetical protein